MHIAMAILAQQPAKGLYLLGALAFEATRFPIYLVRYLLRYGRQHPEWTLRQSLLTHVAAAVIRHLATIQHRTPLPLQAGAEGERFTTIKPAAATAYTGPLRGNADVAPVEIGATWYPAALHAGSTTADVCVLLHIHGGAYVMGDGRTRDSGFMAQTLLRHTNATHLLFPQYRLSTLPASATSNPFPAGLQDSLTAYLYLVNDLAIAPKHIILSGDSAGGNMLIALLRYISEYGADLGISSPSAALLWSPWIDPADTSGSYVHDNDHYATDYISPPFTAWGSAAYAGLAGLETLKQAYISHKHRAFQTPTPLFVNTGGGELLYYDNIEWAEMMDKAGNEVKLDVEPIVPHDILALGNRLGFEKEANHCAKRVGQWLREVRE